METTVNMILVFGVMEYYCYNFLTNFSINFCKFVIILARFSQNIPLKFPLIRPSSLADTKPRQFVAGFGLLLPSLYAKFYSALRIKYSYLE